MSLKRQQSRCFGLVDRISSVIQEYEDTLEEIQVTADRQLKEQVRQLKEVSQTAASKIAAIAVQLAATPQSYMATKELHPRRLQRRTSRSHTSKRSTAPRPKTKDEDESTGPVTRHDERGWTSDDPSTRTQPAARTDSEPPSSDLALIKNYEKLFPATELAGSPVTTDFAGSASDSPTEQTHFKPAKTPTWDSEDELMFPD